MQYKGLIYIRRITFSFYARRVKVTRNMDAAIQVYIHIYMCIEISRRYIYIMITTNHHKVRFNLLKYNLFLQYVIYVLQYRYEIHFIKGRYFDRFNILFLQLVVSLSVEYYCENNVSFYVYNQWFINIYNILLTFPYNICAMKNEIL